VPVRITDIYPASATKVVDPPIPAMPRTRPVVDPWTVTEIREHGIERVVVDQKRVVPGPDTMPVIKVQRQVLIDPNGHKRPTHSTYRQPKQPREELRDTTLSVAGTIMWLRTTVTTPSIVCDAHT
jgi:hypothetical protein